MSDVRPQYAELPSAPSQSVLYRWTVTPPPSWHPGDKYYLRLGNGVRSAYLNGKPVGAVAMKTGGMSRFPAPLRPAPIISWSPPTTDGYNGGASLWRQPARLDALAGRSLERLGGRRTRNAGDSPCRAASTGCWHPDGRDPASWSKSHVFLRLKWDNQAAPGIWQSTIK